MSHEVGDGSGAGIEVVNQLISGKVGKLACHTVEVVSLLGIGLVETLRTYLELQVFHQFEDMVVALEEAELQVVDGIISLLVVYIHERCNLRKLVSHLLHQLQCSLLIALLIVVELEDEHPLSGVRITDHHVAEQTVLLTQVVEGIVVRISIFEYEVADFVAEVIHQPALPDRINLVEGSGDMETDGVLGVALLERCYGIILFLRELSQFLGGEPSLVAASELYLVAVLLSLHAAHDRAELR